MFIRDPGLRRAYEAVDDAKPLSKSDVLQLLEGRSVDDADLEALLAQAPDRFHKDARAELERRIGRSAPVHSPAGPGQTHAAHALRASEMRAAHAPSWHWWESSPLSTTGSLHSGPPRARIVIEGEVFTRRDLEEALRGIPPPRS